MEFGLLIPGYFHESEAEVGTITEIHRIETEELSLEWQVPGALSIISGWAIDWTSPEVRFDNEGWRLKISSNTDVKIYRTLKICLTREIRQEGFVLPPKIIRISFGIGVAAGVEKRVEGEKEFSNLDDTLILDDFCSITDLIGQLSRLRLEDVLTISCTLKIGTPAAYQLQMQVDALKEDIKEYEHQVLELSEQINKCNKDTTTFKTLNDSLVKQLISNEKDFIERLHAKTKIACKLEKEKREYKDQLDKLQESHQTLLREKIKVEKNVFQIFSKKLDQAEVLRKQEIARKDAKINQLEKKNCDYKAQMDKLLEKYQTLPKEKTKLGVEKSYFEIDFQKLNESVTFRNQDIVEKEDKVNGLEIAHPKDEDSSSRSVKSSFQDLMKIPHDVNTLSCDFYADSVCPNFVLKCNKGSIPVNTFVLSVRSEFFREMFQKKMEESETESAEIKDLELPILRSMIKFLYCGKLEGESEDSVVHLYKAGDKYSRILKAACCRRMLRNLTQKNCTTFLSIAESHSDQDLKAAVVSFIFQNPEVMQTTAWLDYSKEHPGLVVDVLQAYISEKLALKRE